MPTLCQWKVQSAPLSTAGLQRGQASEERPVSFARTEVAEQTHHTQLPEASHMTDLSQIPSALGLCSPEAY